MRLNICYLGLVPYDQALTIQYQLLERRQNDQIEDTLLLVEHPPVLTLGTRGKSDHIYLSKEQLDEQGISIYEVNRGGDVTYHGPGQIVGYPIMRLDSASCNVRQFVTNIENAVIGVLRDEFHIHAVRRTDKYTGVWVEDAKITAIGIAVKKWVTMHGFAFNVNTNLAHFDWINPCGLSMAVTSVEALTGQKADMEKTNRLVAQYFAKAFDRTPAACLLPALLGESEGVQHD